MPLQGSRALVRPGWAPPFGWGRTTRLADSCSEAVTRRDRDVTGW